MSNVLAALLGIAAAAFAGLALISRRNFAAAAALAGMGTLVAALLVVSGLPELGVTALACAWGVAAAGLVVGRTLSDVDARSRHGAPRGPWLLAFASSLLIVAALGLAILAVDWPGAHGPTAPSTNPGSLSLAGWALAALGVACSLALAAYSPGGESE